MLCALDVFSFGMIMYKLALIFEKLKRQDIHADIPSLCAVA